MFTALNKGTLGIVLRFFMAQMLSGIDLFSNRLLKNLRGK